MWLQKDGFENDNIAQVTTEETFYAKTIVPNLDHERRTSFVGYVNRTIWIQHSKCWEFELCCKSLREWDCLSGNLASPLMQPNLVNLGKDQDEGNISNPSDV